MDNRFLDLKEERFQAWDYIIFRAVFVSFIFFVIGIITYNKSMIVVSIFTSVIFLIYAFYLIFAKNRSVYSYTWRELFTLPLVPKRKNRK